MSRVCTAYALLKMSKSQQLTPQIFSLSLSPEVKPIRLWPESCLFQSARVSWILDLTKTRTPQA